MHDLLGIVRLLLNRQDDRVDNDVVDEIRAGRPGKSEIAGLNRRRPESENAWPRVLGMPFQVDSDVNPKLVEQPRDILVASCPGIEEPIERRRQPRAYLAALIGTERDRNHFELRPVVPLE